MNDFVEWWTHFPQYLAGVATWFTTPINVLGWSFSPLAAVGVSMGAVLGIVFLAKIVHLFV